MNKGFDRTGASRGRGSVAGTAGVLAVLGLSVVVWFVFAWAMESARASSRPRLALTPTVVSEPDDDMAEFSLRLRADDAGPDSMLRAGDASVVVTMFQRTDALAGDAARPDSLPILLSWLDRRELNGRVACDELFSGQVTSAGFKRKTDRTSVVVVVDMSGEGGAAGWTSSMTGY
ncbi:MAG: hypothetical protein RDV41_09890 [Planctomycetota bacterium]|nr:hypothetical protein [Planctomycetota bacterium]